MRILAVDDELSMREYLDVLLKRWGHDVVVADGVASAQKALEGDFDLVITDMKLKNDSGLTVMKAARSRPFPPEVIIITAFGTPATAIEAVRQGAYDYISKPFDNEEFRLLVHRALEKREIRQENRALKQSLEPVLGKSPPMAEVWSLVEKFAHSPKGTVLVTGESGTGKELVARTIHLRSSRAKSPFMPINCAALADGVLESELFGHVKGAFTGAQNDRVGLLVSAGPGTVFLDEIGEITAAVQVKLLRVLQERMVKPVGSSQEVPFEARIVAATNKDLDAEVKAGRFREDLLYRLNVLSVHVPPLRTRGDDITMLAKAFLATAAVDLGRPGLQFAPATLEVLSRYAFPGNVRQLQNIVERAATLCDGELIGPELLPPTVRGELEKEEVNAQPVDMPPGFSIERTLDDIERRYLKEALRKAETRVQAAQMLGLTFRSFRYRLAKHGLGGDV